MDTALPTTDVHTVRLGSRRDLMMAALAQSRTGSLAGGMTPAESRDRDPPVPLEESDTEKRLRIAKANKNAAGTKNSKIGCVNHIPITHSLFFILLNFP